MRILYVCHAGHRRSPAAAALTSARAPAYGLELSAAFAAASPDTLADHARKIDSQLQQFDEAGGEYAGFADEYRRRRCGISPRIGWVLREQGVDALGMAAQPVTPELVQQAGLVLAMRKFHADDVRKLCGRYVERPRICTLKKYLGYPRGERDIEDIEQYADRTLHGKLAADRLLCESLRTYADAVLERLQAERLEALFS